MGVMPDRYNSSLRIASCDVLWLGSRWVAKVGPAFSPVHRLDRCIDRALIDSLSH